MAAARKNKFGKKREDDLLARSAAVRGARGPGSIFAFGSDRETGRIGQIVQGRLVGPGGDRLAGTGIGRARPTAADIRAGDLRKGIPIGPVGRAAAKVLAQAPAAKAPAAQAAAPAAPTTKAVQPDIRQFPAASAVIDRRRADPKGYEMAKAGRASDKTMVEFGLEPKKGDQSEYWAAYQRFDQDRRGYNDAVMAARGEDVKYARDIEEMERTKAAQEAKEIGVATAKAGLSETQAQADFDRDKEMFGIEQAAKDAGREDDQAFKFELQADRYRRMEEAAQTDDERQKARDMRLFAQEKAIAEYKARQAAMPQVSERQIEVDTETGGFTDTRTTRREGDVGEVETLTDADGNGIDDADEQAMAWAREHAKDMPIKSKAIMERLKKKYPNIYGG